MDPNKYYFSLCQADISHFGQRCTINESTYARMLHTLCNGCYNDVHIHNYIVIYSHVCITKFEKTWLPHSTENTKLPFII